MNALKKIQLLAVGVIINSLSALTLMSAAEAQAACGARYDCTYLNCHNPFWAQSACSANLPPNCAYSTPLACYDGGGSSSCPFMVLCEDH
jgi:hypothetical protein